MENLGRDKLLAELLGQHRKQMGNQLRAFAIALGLGLMCVGIIVLSVMVTM